MRGGVEAWTSSLFSPGLSIVTEGDGKRSLFTTAELSGG
jgi:hypothetical protein